MSRGRAPADAQGCRRRRLGALVLAVATLGGCRRTLPPSSSGLEPGCSVTPAVVVPGEAAVVAYRWRTGPRLSGVPSDLRAFVHFTGADGTVFFGDDHRPLSTTERWQPGQTYEYARPVLVPELVPAGGLEVRLGLFSSGSGERLVLSGQPRGLREYAACTLEVQPPRARAKMRYGDGWYHAESPAGDPFSLRRWMGKQADVGFRNRRQDVVVLLHAETAARAFPVPPVLTLSIDGWSGSLTIPEPQPTLRTVRFPRQALGIEPWSRLRLAMSAAFVPKLLGINDDPRELSLWVHQLQVVETHRLPPALVSAAAPATPIAADATTH